MRVIRVLKVGENEYHAKTWTDKGRELLAMGGSIAEAVGALYLVYGETCLGVQLSLYDNPEGF